MDKETKTIRVFIASLEKLDELKNLGEFGVWTNTPAKQIEQVITNYLKIKKGESNGRLE